MSLFRDVSHVKTISAQAGLPEVSEDACRLILWETELKLRKLIAESLKFMKHFRRDKLTDLDINCALDNLHQPGKMVGLRQNYMNQYKQVDDCKPGLIRLLEAREPGAQYQRAVEGARVRSVQRRAPSDDFFGLVSC